MSRPDRGDRGDRGDRADRPDRPPLVLTIVAAASSADDEDLAVARILAAMQAAQARGLPYRNRLERAASVRDVALLLAGLVDPAGASDPPAILQLVGHGSPGRLRLGAGADALAVLTSDPQVCGMLAGRLTPPTRLLVLGCHTGSDRPSAYVASGKALLASLEAFTGAHVYAADCPVTAADFGDGFLYDGSLVTSCGKPANPTSPVRGRAASRLVRDPDSAATSDSDSDSGSDSGSPTRS